MSCDRFMDQPQVSQGEFVAEQMVRIRSCFISCAHIADGQCDDVGVVVHKSARSMRRHQPG